MPANDPLTHVKDDWAIWSDDIIARARGGESFKPIIFDERSKTPEQSISFRRKVANIYTIDIDILKNCDLTNLWNASEDKLVLYGFTGMPIGSVCLYNLYDDKYYCNFIEDSWWSKSIPLGTGTGWTYLTSVASSALTESEEEALELEKEFNELASTWYKETEKLSSAQQMVLHPAYQKIIGMGKDALPHILRELQKTRGHWIWALAMITREDKGKPGMKFREAVDAWLAWGKSEGYI